MLSYHTKHNTKERVTAYENNTITRLFSQAVLFCKCTSTKGGVQRYICKDCGNTFSENYGLITHYTHLSERQWLEVVRGMIVGSSITDIAKNIGTSTSTVWSCRIKIYQMLMNIYGYCDTLNGIVQADGKYLRVSFKGCKDKSYFIDTLGRLPRHHRSRAERIEYIGDDYKRLVKILMYWSNYFLIDV